MSTARHSLRVAWAWLAEPTLMRRSVASVLVAFVVVWGVLLGYNFVNYKHTHWRRSFWRWRFRWIRWSPGR